MYLGYMVQIIHYTLQVFLNYSNMTRTNDSQFTPLVMISDFFTFYQCLGSSLVYESQHFIIIKFGNPLWWYPFLNI